MVAHLVMVELHRLADYPPQLDVSGSLTEWLGWPALQLVPQWIGGAVVSGSRLFSIHY